MSQVPRDTVSAPDSKTSREAELEELRKQSLAQSNAQKLAESGATPVNMLDWQAQQRALREQERLSKTETAKMLHNYRGETDEISTKLSTLKQEDRKSKQQAAQLLHNYRGTAGVVAARSPKRAGAQQVASELDPQVDQRSGEESVATLAAGFNAQNDTHYAEFASGMQEASTSSPESAVMVDTPGAAAAEMPPPAPVEQNSIPAPTSTMDGHEEWVSVESSTLPSAQNVEEILAAAASADSGEDTMSRAVTEVADNLDEDDSLMTEAHVHASLSGGGHLSLRLDVEFSFGLVSFDSTPNTTKYMDAVGFIAGSLFAESRPAGRGGHAIYNAAFKPFVRLVEEDASFVDSSKKRHVVHASLPMFIIDWGEATSTREGVKTVLKNAIQDGSFLSLAMEAV